jgi:pilus assembly protein CpaC
MSCPNRTQRLRRLFLATLISLQLPAFSHVSGQTPGAPARSGVRMVSHESQQSVKMVINTSREIVTERPFQRVHIQNPNLVSVLPLEGGNRLQISAIATGVTQLDLVAGDDTVHRIDVMVLGDARELEAVLQQAFPGANLQVMPVQQGCIISGVVSSDEHVEQVISIAELYFPTVINRVRVMGVHTIQLETQIMEVSRTKLRELGVDWAFANSGDIVSQSVSGLVGNASTAASLLSTGNETLKVGVVGDSARFLGVVRALRQNNLVKVLANPTLTAVDGRPASFNAGGEIPIIVPAGLGQVGIQYREFGTRVDMVAKVRGEGRIWLEVRPYLSEIDPTRSVTLEGTSVPGLRSRFLETGVEMQAGQTLVLGGLLQNRTETITSGLPFFGDLPYLGVLFRSTRELQNEVELLITVTPNFAGPLDPHEVPAMGPGTSTTSPTDSEFYLRGYVEVPATAGNCPPGSPQAQMLGAYPPVGGSPVTNISTTPSTAVPGSAAPSVSIGPNAPRLATQPGVSNSAVQVDSAGQASRAGVNYR